MTKIKILSPDEVQKIAAGQVVERPANIVKELVENSLDAHASAITIIIENGGKDLIRVIDNGSGMSPDDAHLCIENHATSKLSCVDDLRTIQTFGFRGEALASIAAVSQVSLITKSAEYEEGTHLLIHGGSIIEKKPVACLTGTDISIKNLFFNVPGRHKFLKKRETEYRHIAQFVYALALSNAHVTIKFISEGHEIVNCVATSTLKERCLQLWPHMPAHAIHEFTPTETSIASIHGIVTDQHWVRYDRSSLFFFINNRWINNYTLSNALLKGYEKLLPQGKYPHAAIMLHCDPALIDVNIHPRKEEVRFLHPKIIESMIQQAVKKSLEHQITTQLRKATVAPIIPTDMPLSRAATIVENDNTYKEPIAWEQLLQMTTSAPKEIPPSYLSTAPLINNPPMVTPSIPTQQMAVLEHAPHYQLIGQYKKTYLLLEQEDGLYLIDQHAAHERILYEQFAHHFTAPVTTQLLFPITMHCSPDEFNLCITYIALFHDIGIMIEPFGHNQMIISATPVCAPHIAYDELIRQTMQWIEQEQQIDQHTIRKKVYEKVHAEMACKAAIKAGDVLTTQTMEQLLQDLYSCPNRFACPHGRPTGWLLPLNEIEKKFKRNYKK